MLLLRAGITYYTTLVFSTSRIISHNNQRDQHHVLHGLMKNLLRSIQILLWGVQCLPASTLHPSLPHLSSREEVVVVFSEAAGAFWWTQARMAVSSRWRNKDRTFSDQSWFITIFHNRLRVITHDALANFTDALQSPRRCLGVQAN
jgi:hypothetical protein